MNFIITKDIDGNEILLNLENVSAIEQCKEDRGKTKYFIRQFRPSASIEISAEEFEKFKSIIFYRKNEKRAQSSLFVFMVEVTRF